jgi:hypothetical protein
MLERAMDARVRIITHFDAASISDWVNELRTDFPSIEVERAPQPSPQASVIEWLPWAALAIQFIGNEAVKKFLGGVLKEAGFEDAGTSLAKTIRRLFSTAKERDL